MALHTDLDVYKTGYDLFKKVTGMVRNMERSYKRLIGEDIVEEMKRVLILVYRANVADDKVPHLSQLIERVKLLEALFRLSWDLHEITDRQYYGVIRLTESISKQAVKWREWSATARLMEVHAAMTEHRFNLVVPLAHKATAMRIEDTDASVRTGPAQFPGLSNRPGDVDSTMVPLTPGIRTTTTATRTTTTRARSSAALPSADWIERNDGFSGAELVAAYRDCRRTKRNSTSALAFEANLERNLMQLHDELADGSYVPGRSICFVVTRPKPREVWAADFRDRIVHHLLYRRFGARFENAFIADSCACIPGRGTLYAARRLEAKVRSVTQNWSRPAYYLKCDLANFFVSIDKRILLELLAARIVEPWWMALAELVLMHDPRTDFKFRGDRRLFDLVPPHKRLLNQPAHLGLPIGNLSSQFFANVYLDVLDQRAKHALRARHYIRYVDDFLFLHESADWLNATLRDVDTFLPERLGVQLNPRKTILQPVERGIDFVGHVIKPWQRYTRRRTFNEALRRVAQAPSADVFEMANSYFGLMRQATASHHDRARLANVVRDRGHAVDKNLTKTYRSHAA